MINRSKPTTVPSQENGAPSATELLEAITPEQERQLQAFARLRLRRVAYAPWLQRYFASISAEDLVQQAKTKVLIGEAFPRAGRRLTARNRASVEACLACLRGIMQIARRRGEHLPVGDAGADLGNVDPADPLDPVAHLARRDLSRVVFARLRERAAAEPDLWPALQRWEEGFLSDDRVAAGELDRKPAYRLRVFAREILKELSAELSVAPVSGREILI
jgi:hypothetical protein